MRSPREIEYLRLLRTEGPIRAIDLPEHLHPAHHTCRQDGLSGAPSERPDPRFVWVALTDRGELELEAIEATATQTVEDDAPLTPETRAILLITETLKKTGELPTKTDIAKTLGINRRTLNNWQAFKVAYAQAKAGQLGKGPPRGTKSAEGDLEAWEK